LERPHKNISIQAYSQVIRIYKKIEKMGITLQPLGRVSQKISCTFTGHKEHVKEVSYG